MTFQSQVVQKGDLVLITGATGWVGGHVAAEALRHGLRVRLAVRDPAKTEKLINGLKSEFGQDAAIELVTVKDFNSDTAYDEAIKGVHGVMHTASIISFSDKWDEVIPPTIQGYKTILEAANREKSVKRVVLTSSSTALGLPNVEGAPQQHFTVESWNNFAVDEAKKNPNPFLVYAASKVLSEQFAWDYVREHKPAYTLNTVLPNMCLGRKLPGSTYMSTGEWAYDVVMNKDKSGVLKMLPSQYHIDVDDVGTLHVLGLTRQDVQNERIIAFGERFTWDQLIDLGKKIRSDANPADKTKDTGREDNTTVELDRTRELLKPYGGLKSLRHSLELNLQD